MPQLIDFLMPKTLRQGISQDRFGRARFGRLEGWVSIVVNALLFISKLVVGVIINSLALIADAFHSLSDVLTSIIVLVGYAFSEKPGDREHPYGHQRIEHVATLIVAILLGVVGFEFIRQGYLRLRNPEPVQAGWLILIFIVITIVVKYLLGAYSHRLGSLIQSTALKADAFHHYSDSASSILVLVAVWASNRGFPILDGIAGVAMGGILIYGGFKIAKDSADSLIGQPPSPEIIRRIRKICRGVPGVLDAHDIIVHAYGERLFISVHVEIDQQNSSLQAHTISDAVEEALGQEISSLATVHIDPVDTHNEVLQKLRSELDRIIAQYPQVSEYHDLRIITRPNHKLILFDLVVDNSEPLLTIPVKVMDEIKHHLTTLFPGYDIEISVDPVYIFN